MVGVTVMTIADALAYSICNQVFVPEDTGTCWTVVMVVQGLGYMLGSLFGKSMNNSYRTLMLASHCPEFDTDGHTNVEMCILRELGCMVKSRKLLRRVKHSTGDYHDYTLA